ncbi:MAG TPA: hypothetical protein DIT64_21960 [Verrucomicrobiales bacterium]|nr:hypothetical protein [Verrucomicrobiales bacterium]
MILGLTHAVLGSADMTADRAFFETRGWQPRFVQEGIPVFAGKRPWMSTASQEVALAYLDSPGLPALELIAYSQPPPAGIAAPLQMIFPANRLPEVAEENATPLAGVRARQYAGITCPLWVSDAAADQGCIVHHVRDMEAARRFWVDGFGFQVVEHGMGQGHPACAEQAGRLFPMQPMQNALSLRFPSLMPQWRARLLLLPCTDAPAPALLDGPGFRVVSMVSTKFGVDRARIFEQGGARASTGVMEEVIGGKKMLLDLIEGPDGVMVEIFQTLA